MSGLQERLEGIRKRVDAACGRAGRDPAEVSILAVSKTFGPDNVREAAECGLAVFGESRVQEARQKIPLCPGHLQWHLIGHLQRNKVRDAAPLFSMIHSVDSWKLLETIDGACQTLGRVMPVCLEVNVSGERSKFGLPPDEVPALLQRGESLVNVEIVGLMTIPPFTEDPEEARPFFRRLRELRDERRRGGGSPLRELSIGMSHDFEVAVEEGATWIRLGTILFGDRPRKQESPEEFQAET